LGLTAKLRPAAGKQMADDWMNRDFEEHPLRQPRRGGGGWWVAAVAAVVAVIGAIAFLSASTSPARLATAHASGRPPARAAGRAERIQLAGGAASSTAATQRRARATEAAAQDGAANASAAAQDASATTAAAPQP
jgi:hypothetical protein